MEVRDQILEKLKSAVTSGQLDAIIDRIDTATRGIDNIITKADGYLTRLFKEIKKDTSNIRELTSKLPSDHIEKIRMQLFQEPLLIMASKSTRH